MEKGRNRWIRVSNWIGISSLRSGESSSSAEEKYVPEKLTVQFVPSQAAETLEAKAKPLEKLLSDKLGIPVTVSVSTDYNTIVEAMASKQVDVGFCLQMLMFWLMNKAM